MVKEEVLKKMETRDKKENNNNNKVNTCFTEHAPVLVYIDAMTSIRCVSTYFSQLNHTVK